VNDRHLRAQTFMCSTSRHRGNRALPFYPEMLQGQKSRRLSLQFLTVPAHPATIDLKCARLSMDKHCSFAATLRTIRNPVPASHGLSSGVHDIHSRDIARNAEQK
jgi:hypothetical protein